MRVFISADGEGITSLVHSQEMYPGAADYEFGRHMMTMDVNAAIEGAFAAGATEVVVNDGHWNDLSVLPLKLDSRAQLMRGSGKPMSMMHGISEGFDLAFFVGYHGRVGGSNGVANETIMGKQIYDVMVNGESVGELELNAAIAAQFGVPVGLVTGDDRLAAETKRVLPDTEAAIVKYAIERWSARCLSPERAWQEIRERAAQAVTMRSAGQLAKAYTFTFPAKCEVEFISTAEASAACVMPGVERTEQRRVMYVAHDASEAWRAVLSMMLLGCRMTDDIYG